MTAYEISNDVCEKATLCNKSCMCLLHPECMCREVGSIEFFILFVEPADNTYCKYKMQFRDRFTCECPVRKEFFRKCGI